MNLFIFSFRMKLHRNIPLTLALSVILIGILSFFMPKNKEKYLKDRFWSQKTFAPPVFDGVIIGDSRSYRGLIPSVIEEKTPGLRFLNFAYSNGGLNRVIYQAAEKKLSPESKNKVIIIGVSANGITGFTKNNDQYLQELNRPREEVFERIYLNGFLYYFSATTPEQLRDSLTGKRSPVIYRNDYFADGYVASEKFPRDTLEALASYIKDFSVYKVDSNLVNELAAQVKEWSEKGITVIGFRPPVTMDMKALEDTMGLYNEAEISGKFTSAGGHWITLPSTSFSTYDGSHLDIASANRLSEIIGEELLTLIEN